MGGFKRLKDDFLRDPTLRISEFCYFFVLYMEAFDTMFYFYGSSSIAVGGDLYTERLFRGSSDLALIVWSTTAKKQ
jgi:hypothetical protein